MSSEIQEEIKTEASTATEAQPKTKTTAKKTASKTTKVKAAKSTAVKKEAKGSSKKKAKSEEKHNPLRDITLAYIGAISKYVDAMGSLRNKLKDDKEGLYNDLIKSGEVMTEKYMVEARKKAQELKKRLPIKSDKKAA
jgi:hypothetical protein